MDANIIYKKPGVKLVDLQDNRGRTALAMEIEKGSTVAVKRLLEEGANPALADKNGQTPLHRAMIVGNCEIIQALLDRRVDLVVRNAEGQTPLQCGVHYGQLAAVKMLLSNPVAKVQSQLAFRDEDGKTVLHYGALQSNAEMMTWLLQTGVNVNAKTEYHYIPLHFAARQGHLEVARVLVAHGADVDCKNVNGDSPKKLAIQFNNLEMALFLAKKSPKRQRALVSGNHWKLKELLQGDLYRYRGEFDKAEKAYRKVFEWAENHKDVALQINCLKKLGDVMLDSRKKLQAALLYNSAYVLCDRQGCLNTSLVERFVRIEYGPEVAKQEVLVLADRILARRKRLQEMREKTKRGLAEGLSARTMMREVTDFMKDLTIQLIQECFDFLEEPPCKYAIIGLGPMSQDEMLPYSDLKMGILLQENTVENREYFLKVTQLLELKMVNLGERSFPVLNKGRKSLMPEGFFLSRIFNPLVRAELLSTPEEIRTLQKSTEQDLILSNMLQTICFLYGDISLLSNHEAALKKRQKHILPLLKEALNAFNPENTPNREGEEWLHLKERFYRFPVEVIHKICQFYGIEAKNSWERLEVLQRNKVFSKEGFQHLSRALEAINLLRLRVQSCRGENCEEVHFLRVHSGSVEREDFYELNPEEQESLMQVYQVLLPFYEALKIFCDKGGKGAALKGSFYTEKFKENGASYERLCNYDRAEECYRMAVKNNPDDWEAFDALGRVLQQKIQCEEAVKYHEKALALLRNKKGDNALEEAVIFNHLGNAKSDLGKKREALRDYETALDRYKAIYGVKWNEDQVEVADMLNNLGVVTNDLGEYQKAISYFEEALYIYQSVHGEGHLNTAYPLLGLSLAFYHMKDNGKALSCCQQAYAIFETIEGDGHAHICVTLNTLAKIWEARKDVVRAEACYEEALAIADRLYPNGLHPQKKQALEGLDRLRKPCETHDENFFEGLLNKLDFA